MRRLVLTAAVVLAAVVLQLTVVNAVPWPGGGTPDLVLLAVVAFGLCGSPMSGAVTGFLAGLSLDIAPPGSYLVGEYALVFCLVGYCCGRLAGPREDSVWRPVCWAVAAAAAGEVLQAGLGRATSDPQVTWLAVREVLPSSVLYDAIASPFALYLIMRLLAWADELGPAGELAKTVSPEQARAAAAALPGAGLLGGAGWVTGPGAGSAARAARTGRGGRVLRIWRTGRAPGGRVPRLREAAARPGDGWIGIGPAPGRSAGWRPGGARPGGGRLAGWRGAGRTPRLRPGSGQAGSAAALAAPARLAGRGGPAGSAFRGASHRPAGTAARSTGRGPRPAAFRRRGHAGPRPLNAAALHGAALNGRALRDTGAAAGPRRSALRGAGARGPALRGAALRNAALGGGGPARGPAFRSAGAGASPLSLRAARSGLRGAGWPAGPGPSRAALRGAGPGLHGSALHGSALHGSALRGSALRAAGRGSRGPAFRDAGSGPRGLAGRGGRLGPRGAAFRGGRAGPGGTAFRAAGRGPNGSAFGGSAFGGAPSGGWAFNSMSGGSALRGPGLAGSRAAGGGRAIGPGLASSGPGILRLPWRRGRGRAGGLVLRRGRAGPVFTAGKARAGRAGLSLLAGSGAPAKAPRFRLDARLPGGSAFGSPGRRALPGRPASPRLRTLRRRDGAFGATLTRTGQARPGLAGRPVRLRLGSSLRRRDGTVGGLASGRFAAGRRKAAPRFRTGTGVLAGAARSGSGAGKQARFRKSRRSALAATWTGGKLGARSGVWRIGSKRQLRRLS